MSEKVKVSREVAEAINELESWIGTDKDRVDKIIKFAELLAYGHEVEPTLEEKWAKKFERAVATGSNGFIPFEDRREAIGQIKTIQEMARDFNIKIKGINA